MADIVVDANVLVGLMDERDSLFGRATNLLERLDARLKGGVRLLTKSTAVSHAAEKIRCNSIHPGVIDTPSLHGVFQLPPPYDVLSPRERDEYAARNPHNVVHLTLPVHRDNDRVAGFDAVTGAGAKAHAAGGFDHRRPAYDARLAITKRLDLLLTAGLAGLRQGELFALRRADIDISGRSAVLKTNYRNTRQILEAAQRQIEVVVADLRLRVEEDRRRGEHVDVRFDLVIDTGADVAERGIVLTGGGALLRDLDKLISEGGKAYCCRFGLSLHGALDQAEENAPGGAIEKVGADARGASVGRNVFQHGDPAATPSPPRPGAPTAHERRPP